MTGSAAGDAGDGAGESPHLLTLIQHCVDRHGNRLCRALYRRHKHDPEAARRALAAAIGVGVDQPSRAHRLTDQVTILACVHGCRATKRITPAGISDYACGKWFGAAEVEFAGIGGLADLLTNIEQNPRLFIIRGRLIEGRDPRRVRRLLHHDPKTGDAPYFESCPRRWCGLDFDALALPAGVDPVDLPAVAAVAIARLPAPFQRATCWAQLTGSAGFKPGGRARLFYVLDRRTSGADLKRWLAAVPGLDGSTLNDVTPNYVARPIFDGVADPVPLRSKLIAGEVDAVAGRIPPPPPPRATAAPRAHVPRSTFTPSVFGRGGSARAEAYAAACLRRLALAPERSRHATCVVVSCRLLALAKAGLLDPMQVASQVKGVMLGRGFDGRSGRDLGEVDSILEWAWQQVEPEGLPP